MKKIAIIEDNRAIQHVVRGILQKSGFKTSSIYSGQDLKHEIENVDYDLILTDILLPSITAKHLIDIYKNINKPIIVMSSLDKEDALFFAKSINAIAYINKNEKQGNMVTSLRKILANAEENLLN